MNRKQRRVGIKQKKASNHFRPTPITQEEMNQKLSDIMSLFGDATPEEEVVKVLESTGKYSVKNSPVTFRIVALKDGIEEIQDILANGGTIEYPES